MPIPCGTSGKQCPRLNVPCCHLQMEQGGGKRHVLGPSSPKIPTSPYPQVWDVTTKNPQAKSSGVRPEPEAILRASPLRCCESRARSPVSTGLSNLGSTTYEAWTRRSWSRGPGGAPS